LEKLTSLMSKPGRILLWKNESHASRCEARHVTIPQWSITMNKSDGLEESIAILQATVKNSN